MSQADIVNLFQLRVFDVVAREGSFIRAAERLCISQPAMIGHAKILEEHYQVTLFRRAARCIELTEEGPCLVTITRTLFTLKEGAGALLDANRQLVSGCLEVAADSLHLVMLMLVRLRASYPGVIVNLCLGNVQEVLAALLSEHANVAVLAEVEARPGLFPEELVNSRICTLLPHQRPWCERSEDVLLEELDQQIMVLREPSPVTRRTFDRVCASQGVQPRVLPELDNRETVIEVVIAELGAGVMSSLEVGNDPRVRTVPLVGPELINCHLIGCLEKCRGLRMIRVFLGLATA